METLKIEYLQISDLRPYKKNARKHGAEDVKAIAESIRTFGFNDPIGLWSDKNVIVEGHGRLEAAKLLGLSVVPCIRLDHLSDEQRRAYALAHNKTAENSVWDPEMVSVELSEISGYDMSAFGFDLSEIVPRESEWFENRERYEDIPDDADDEYLEFVDKFKPKHTTDDCYTPDNIYDSVAEYVARTYGKSRENFVRPFYPGGDYQRYKYKPDDIVVDNPPFSILAEIVSFYASEGISFFIFAPTLTLFTSWKNKVTFIPVGVSVTYENGATVDTSFITNMEEDNQVRTAPDLRKELEAEDKKNREKTRKEQPRYSFPDHVITAAMCARWAKYGIEYKLTRSDCVRIGSLDSMDAAGKAIYGGGFLLSERAAAERAAAERAAAERWKLSDRELQIVASLGSASSE